MHVTFNVSEKCGGVNKIGGQKARTSSKHKHFMCIPMTDDLCTLL